MSNNPQAFPCLDSSDGGLSMRDPGMTLRDYFAGQALANKNICHGDATKWELTKWFGEYASGVTRSQIIARQALEVADAMLAARAKSGADQ